MFWVLRRDHHFESRAIFNYSTRRKALRSGSEERPSPFLPSILRFSSLSFSPHSSFLPLARFSYFFPPFVSVIHSPRFLVWIAFSSFSEMQGRDWRVACPAIAFHTAILYINKKNRYTRGIFTTEKSHANKIMAKESNFVKGFSYCTFFYDSGKNIPDGKRESFRIILKIFMKEKPEIWLLHLERKADWGFVHEKLGCHSGVPDKFLHVSGFASVPMKGRGRG